MKRILLGIAAALLMLAGVVVIRTIQAGGAAPTADGSPQPPGADSNVVAAHLSQAIKFETVSYDDGVKLKERNAAIANFREWMDRTYPYIFEAAPQEIVGESLLFTWRGTNPNLAPVLIMAHMDVAPVASDSEKDWEHAPFSGDIADGYVWGRGAMDDKSALVAILEAGERIAQSGYQPTRTIMFAFGQDEEVGGKNGNGAIASALKARGVRFQWVLDEGLPIYNEPYPGLRKPIALVGVGEKGYLSLNLTARGEGGHSADPPQDLVLPRLAAAVSKVTASPFVSDLDTIQRDYLNMLTPYVPFMDRMALANLWLTKPLVVGRMEASPQLAPLLHTTIAPTILAGGTKDNVLPDTAEATINFRLHPRDTIASVTEHVRRAIGDPNVEIQADKETSLEASPVVPSADPAYRYIANTLKTTFAVPVMPQMMTGSTDSSHYLSIADAVLRVWPFALDPEDIPRLHGTNERIAVDSLGPAVGFYLRLMRDMP